MRVDTYAFVAERYDLWTFLIEPASITYDSTMRAGSRLYGRPVIPDGATGRLRLTRDGEEPFGYLGRVMPDGYAECVARRPAIPLEGETLHYPAFTEIEMGAVRHALEHAIEDAPVKTRYQAALAKLRDAE